MLKKINGVTGETTIVPTPPEGRVSVESIVEKFDAWYREQKEINPYIMRDYFIVLIKAERAAHKEEKERLVDSLLAEAVDITNFDQGVLVSDIVKIAAKFNIDVK